MSFLIIEIVNASTALKTFLTFPFNLLLCPVCFLHLKAIPDGFSVTADRL